FSFLEVESLAVEIHVLVAQAYQVHLDAVQAGVVEGAVAEPVEMEVGPQLAVDAGQQVKVEVGRHAAGVVVGRLEDRQVFLQIESQAHRPARADQGRHAGKQHLRLGRAEVADRRAGEVDDAPPFAPPRTGQSQRAGEVSTQGQHFEAGVLFGQL